MISLHKELTKILNEEKSLLEILFKTVSEERDAIVGLNSVELEKILREKEQTLIKLSLWEEERVKLLAKNGLENTTLSEILEMNNESPELIQLKELYYSMKTLLNAISEIQRINEQLIDRSIMHIGTAIKFLETFGINAKQSLSREA
ncbi:flagellar protein FlgN [Thermodesulfovibrio yellowstonii]|uniref:Flagellar protein FlgN n=1 Tax=Thermodesulfovibrio yellowstonii TaxID=28262 RepID=A0A9W6GEI9_9BACT|nr:flagellar protein FlgN [Thermodesulfovibrio islandicus]GLI52484.1 flagellar protein FlgN [Thermodesulfovibrio islandicus]